MSEPLEDVLKRPDVDKYISQLIVTARKKARRVAIIKNLSMMSFHPIFLGLERDIAAQTEQKFGMKKGSFVVLSALYAWMTIWNFKRYTPQNYPYETMLKFQMSRYTFRNLCNYLASEGYLIYMPYTQFNTNERFFMRKHKKTRSRIYRMDARVDRIMDYFQAEINIRCGIMFSQHEIFHYNFEKSARYVDLRLKHIKDTPSTEP